MGVPSVLAGDRPNAIAIHPSGRFAYVCNTGSADNTVSQYAIGTDGALSSIGPNVVTDNEPLGLAIDPSGRYLYVANRSASTVTQYTIGADGVLAPMGTPSVSIPGGGPIRIAVDPSGRYAYTSNRRQQRRNFPRTDGALSVLDTAISTGTDTDLIHRYYGRDSVDNQSCSQTGRPIHSPSPPPARSSNPAGDRELQTQQEIRHENAMQTATHRQATERCSDFDAVRIPRRLWRRRRL